MAILDRITQMHSQGMQDPEIIKRLSDEGLPLRDINDAINQSRIKMAVTQQTTDATEIEQVPEYSQAPPAYDSGQQFPQSYPDQYNQTQVQQTYPEQYTQEQQYYPQEQQYSPAIDTETITQISEQIINEKIKELKESMGDISTFKSSTQEKIADLNERIKRIENSLDKIQQAIIGKIGEFGESVTYIHKDLENLHDTTSKLMNPLIDNYRAMKGYSSPSPQSLENNKENVSKQVKAKKLEL